MKIAITSDLHLGGLGIGKKDIAPMVLSIANEQPDLVVLAGDIGELTHQFNQCLGLFRNIECPLLVLLGNNDLWAYEFPNENSKELWETTLPKIIKKRGYIYLEEQNYYLENTAIVGSYMHYDYSAADTVGVCSGYTDAWWEMNKCGVNNDGEYLIGLPSDKEFAAIINEAFLARLDEAQQREDITQIIIVTHVPCLEEQITRKPYDYEWSVGTPYFGNITHQDRILGCSKVTHVVSGHSHQDVKREVNGVQISVIPSDYKSPKYELILI